MSHSSTGHRDEPGWYEIRLGGHLDPRWATRFDGMTLTSLSDGTTRIQGPVTDQAALYGLLHKLGDIGLPLISVTGAEPDTAPNPAPESPPS
jgi:hypothetical protein